MRGPLAALVLLNSVALAQEVQPQYSEEAGIARLEGRVVVSAVVSSDGALDNFSIEQPLGLGLDEQAIRALQRVRLPGGYAPGVRSTFPVNFTLPSSGSPWHLVRITFKAPPGASRPTFASANYSPGAGLTGDAYDEAMLLSAIKRAAYAAIAFDIDERGEPDNFTVIDESAHTWGPEAVALMKNWRFHPGMQNGQAIKVPCEVALMWGATFAQELGFVSSPEAPRYPAGPTPSNPIADDVTQPQPEYTIEARNAGIEGVVWIDLIVDQAGVPQNPTVTLALEGGLTQQAVSAVQAWRFPPALLNGEPTPRKGSVRIEFNLTGVKSTMFWDVR